MLNGGFLSGEERCVTTLKTAARETRYPEVASRKEVGRRSREMVPVRRSIPFPLASLADALLARHAIFRLGGKIA